MNCKIFETSQIIYIYGICILFVGWDSSVGIVTCYGLNEPGIETQWGGGGERFFATVQISPGAHPTSYTMGTGSFPEVKRPGRGVENPPHLEPRSKKEWSYTSIPPLGLRGLFRVKFTFNLYNKQIAIR
jgi:hypothetical protein